MHLVSLVVERHVGRPTAKRTLRYHLLSKTRGSTQTGILLQEATERPFVFRVSMTTFKILFDSRQERSSGTGLKQPSSETNAALPLSKRLRQSSPTKASIESLPNKIHRRIILRDYGKPIYKASSRKALLAALMECTEGHHSLHKAGVLHRDISVYLSTSS